jgi:hypothetical protein
MLVTQAETPGKYTPDWIEMFLRNYNMLIGDAAELAAEWDKMHEQERIDHLSISMQVWGMRVTLGELYRAARLTPDQVARLADLDRALLEEAANVEIAYGPSLHQLVENLLDWGTPLTEMEGTVRLEMPLKVLPALAQALVGEVVSPTELKTAVS